MEELYGDFGFSVVEQAPNKQRATVVVGRDYVHALYKEALLSRQKQVKTYGFEKGLTPLHYIEQNFQTSILEHLKELLFTHCVIHLLYDSLTNKKLVLMGDPDLVGIDLKPNNNAEFFFDLASISFDREERWKSINPKKSRRKKYKDLDRKVDHFIKEELDIKKKTPPSDTIGLEDWVNFTVSLLDTDNHDLIPGYKSDLWICIHHHEDDKKLQELLLGKKVGDSFITDNVFLQEYLSPASDITYRFKVEIKQRLQGGYVSFDLFKHQFGLDNDLDIHTKLIEVFSTRNDLTLRREIIEGALSVLSKQYKFILPQHLVEQQKQMVIEELQDTPDYHVYKMRNDFDQNVTALAEKQLRETIIIDSIAFQKGLTVDDLDICAYLNLLKRPRVKSFMYFRLPQPKVHGHEAPISRALLKRYCLREKTLNTLLNEIVHQKKL